MATAQLSQQKGNNPTLPFEGQNQSNDLGMQS